MTAPFTEPPRFQFWGPAFRGAFMKGYRAAMSGEAKDSCPYLDMRNDENRITWSRAFISAWEDGWDWFFSQENKD